MKTRNESKAETMLFPALIVLAVSVLILIAHLIALATVTPA